MYISNIRENVPVEPSALLAEEGVEEGGEEEEEEEEEKFSYITSFGKGNQ